MLSTKFCRIGLFTIKLPEAVCVGRHQIVIVLEENESEKNITDTHAKKLMQLAGSISAFKNVDGVEYQKQVRSEWN